MPYSKHSGSKSFSRYDLDTECLKRDKLAVLAPRVMGTYLVQSLKNSGGLSNLCHVEGLISKK